ncbi:MULTISPECIES: helix-turn-helix domain-containing protein [Halobacterium]|uniref:HTH domain protein n=4 Tax=Halobacterium salinarum TaxID=2242 RepID=Q9HPS6_HALSA|nr:MULTISPECIES: helix-turn-helix domain-containing protein [Halobacterium]AAG19791.1 hypothetical protein VNG_1490H [Halobacterium salinarum NRC-1]MBB6088794.1 DNA-binding transcriptional ArsR family regulator [Halobacterium salinarum]MCF2165303.1 helix-turn-helix domain-containing protein [Halobacterium salinarum]MCF2167888.1 helix-turn-helix domain-containing protein [Halobacterium salinarum]MCF2206306.1 helix-turn-helix domain-containing protein [Halobacterium salinarum]
MSQSQLAAPSRTADDDDSDITATGELMQRILDAFDDAECRQILESTDDAALTAGEIADECDLPSSTAYRKIDRLTEAGLLSETLRIRRSGKHVSEYTCTVDDVTLSVSHNGVEATLSCTPTDAGTAGPAQPFAD